MCLTCYGAGITFHSRKGYPMHRHQHWFTARACHNCKKGALVKKFKLLRHANNYHPVREEAKYKKEVWKVLETLNNMELSNAKL